VSCQSHRQALDVTYFAFVVVVLVSCKSENPAAERLNLSFDTVSLDSSSGRRDAAQEDDSDFYSGIAAAGSSLQNGVAAAVTSSSSSYSEALTPVTNKVSFIILTEWTSFTCFYIVRIENLTLF
jgi:hypothetical protein